MKPIQFNIQLPNKIARKVRQDAVRFRKSLGSISEAIFKDFFQSFTLTERGKHYEKFPPKKAGRKL